MQNAMVIAFNVASFSPARRLSARRRPADRVWWKGLPRREGFDELLLPGERGGARGAGATTKTVSPCIASKLWRELSDIAQALGVPQPPHTAVIRGGASLMNWGESATAVHDRGAERGTLTGFACATSPHLRKKYRRAGNQVSAISFLQYSGESDRVPGGCCPGTRNVGARRRAVTIPWGRRTTCDVLFTSTGAAPHVRL